MTLPVDSIELANSLSAVLPFIADSDPAFAKLALDRERWRSLVLADRIISDKQRAKQLEMIDGLWFAHTLNNALLHVLGGLANNHFVLIGDYC